MFETITTATASYLHFSDLGLDPNALEITLFGRDLALKWYSLAYIVGILLGWWYMLRLLGQPGAPMARRHADDLVFYATLGVILGGRVGYVLFYQPAMLLQPLSILRLWDGGMSFHGGAIGVVLAILYLAHRNGLSALRILDYVTCCAPIGQFLGRMANFVNGELWGRPTDVPWAIVFPDTVAGGVDPARHPSQLYEAGAEGLLLFAVLAWFFWRTNARYYPGRLLGIGLIGFGVGRFVIEFFRQPDRQLQWLVDATGLSMGQWLNVPMIVVGIYFVATAQRRRQRVEPIAGSESVA